MALKPILKPKVDELFIRWFSDPDVQALLKQNLHEIKNGLKLSLTPYPTALPTVIVSPRTSPRFHPLSPPLTPPAGKLISPRSPRRHVTSVKSKGPMVDILLHNNKEAVNGVTFRKELVLPQTPHSPNPKSQAVVDETSGTSLEKSKTPSNLHKSSILIENKSPKRTNIVEPTPISENKFPTENVPSTDSICQPNKPLPSCIDIPRFYFPRGQPVTIKDTETILAAIDNVFQNAEDGKLYKTEITKLVTAFNLPLYWKMALFVAGNGLTQGYVTHCDISSLCQDLFDTCHDAAAKFMRLLAKPGCSHLVPEDFVPIIQDIVDDHPGLNFLQESPEFHSRYINTVISRIFYDVNRSWSGRITLPELRNSKFLKTLKFLEEEEDINQIVDFFSYEHFYVIYCKFWELDKDHDLFIDKSDLASHNNHALCSRVIDRIFSGCVTRGDTLKEGRLSYPDFVWFLLAEEDKQHPRSIEFWFRCMDLDGDGVISMYEMEYFYEEQMQKMEALGIEKLPFEDALCQMLDLVKPKLADRITLSDLKACKMTNIFFDTFLNLDKFLDHEQRDPFANLRELDMDVSDMSDWERFAAIEYEILVAEEGAAEQEIQYEDDFEGGDDDLLPDELIQLTDAAGKSPHIAMTTNDIYDFNLNDIKY